MPPVEESPDQIRQVLDRLEAGLDKETTVPTSGEFENRAPANRRSHIHWVWSCVTDCDELECDEALTSLHLYTRTIGNPNSDPLTTRRGLSIVGRYAFGNDDVSISTSRIAARCLNNIIVLAEPMRQVFVDEQYPEKVIRRLKVLEPLAHLSRSRC